MKQQLLDTLWTLRWHIQNESGVTLEGPTGTTVPTLAIDELNAGDLLTLNLDAAQGGGAENCGLILYYIPR